MQLFYTLNYEIVYYSQQYEWGSKVLPMRAGPARGMRRTVQWSSRTKMPRRWALTRSSSTTRCTFWAQRPAVSGYYNIIIFKKHCLFIYNKIDFVISCWHPLASWATRLLVQLHSANGDTEQLWDWVWSLEVHSQGLPRETVDLWLRGEETLHRDMSVRLECWNRGSSECTFGICDCMI